MPLNYNLIKTAKKSLLTGAQMPAMTAGDFVAGSRSNMLKEMREARGLYTALKLRKSLNNQDLLNTYKGMFKHVNPEHLDMAKVTDKQLEEMLALKLNNGLRIKSVNTNDYLGGPKFTFKGNTNKAPEKAFSHSKDAYAGARTNYAWASMFDRVDANIDRRLRGTGARVASASKAVNVDSLIKARRQGDKGFNLGNEIENYMKARAVPYDTGSNLIPERLLPKEHVKSRDLPNMYQNAFKDRGPKATATREGLVNDLGAWHKLNKQRELNRTSFIYLDKKNDLQASKYKFKYSKYDSSIDPPHALYNRIDGSYQGFKTFTWPNSGGEHLMRDTGMNNKFYKQRWPASDYTMAHNLDYSEQLKGGWDTYTPTPSSYFTGVVKR